MKTALLLLAFNRVDYFSQTLLSLEANPEAHNHDLHLYLDGGQQAKQDELLALMEQSSFRNVTVVKRDSNWGVGRHLIDARRTLFDQLHYDRIILFEDDMILHPNYVKDVLVLSNWTGTFCDVGTVMAYNLNTSSKVKQQAALHQVIVTNRHFWGYCISKKVWDDIKDIVYQYERKYLMDTDYSDRPHRRIRWFFIRKWIKKGRKNKQGKTLIPEENQSAPFPRFSWRLPTSQDAITALALWARGYSRLTTVVPRARYIGESGVHFSPKVYKAQGFDTQQDFDFSAECVDPEFKLVVHDEAGNPVKPSHYE